MNSIVENILTRRSIRSFKEDQISIEDLNVILKAATYAPSGMNKQSWQFTAIRNKSKIMHLSKVISETLGRDKNYNMYNPPTIVLVSNDRANNNGLADCACALQNIFLAAHSLGIGSCWINQLKTICDIPVVRNLLDDFEIPENHVVWGIAALGYASETPKGHTIREGIIKIIE